MCERENLNLMRFMDALGLFLRFLKMTLLSPTFYLPSCIWIWSKLTHLCRLYFAHSHRAYYLYLQIVYVRKCSFLSGFGSVFGPLFFEIQISVGFRF